MIKLFELVNGVVVATVHCTTLKFLRLIKEEYPDDHLKIYQYLFYMTCPVPDLNPFFHTPADEKEEMILEELEPEFSIEDDLIVAGIEKCHRLYATPTSRAYEGISIALDNLAKFMRDTAITGGKDANVLQISSVAKNFDSMRQSYKGVYKDLQEEQASKVRGNKNLAYDEDDD